MKKFKVTVNGQAYDVEVEDMGGTGTALATRPQSAPAVKPAAPAAPIVQPAAPVPAPKEPLPEGAVTINAPMPGKVSFIKVEAGTEVKRGDVVLVLEAMKMMNDITAPQDGKISEIRVNVGDNVKTGEVMIVM